MGTEQRCPTCGKALEANAPGGLCPECLIKVGLGSGVALGADTATGATRRDFVPPPVEKLGPLFPQLEILELIGKGGMGAVYKARQRELDRIVALKILPPDVGQDAAFAERFTREARALAKLNHPGIVTIYDFGRADGLYFFLMEYVDGVSLQQLMHGGRVSAREALAIVPQICDALQFAHDQGIVHRDIKPGNILLDRRGRVKVADFGLAKIIGNQNEGEPSGGESAPASSALSDASKVMGTPQYMSPEQISAPGEVDHRADIYALGVVFYQMLTGELPGKPIEPPSSKVQIDVRLDEVVLRALEQKPELRYQQASLLKTEVETIVTTPLAAGSRGSAAATPPSDEAKAPAPPTADDLEEVRRQVTAPAIGLIVSSVLYGLFLIAVLFAVTIAELNFGGNGAPFPWWILVLMGFDIVAFAGALRMRRLRSRQLAVAGSVSAMLGLTLPFGIWAFVVLNRREVREAFGKGDREPPVNAPPMTAKSGRLRAALIVALVVWFFVAGTVTVITWIPPESWKVVAVISCPRKSQPGRPVDMDYFKHAATMIELIRSDVILGRVIDRLELDERSGKLDERWGKRNLGLKLTKAQAMVLLRWRLDVRSSKGGTLIQVGVYGKRPEKWEEAMDIAAAIAEELHAFRIEQHDPPADMLEMTARATSPDILFGLAAGFVPGLLAGGLVLRWGFLRRRSQASQVKKGVETIVGSASAPPAEPARKNSTGKSIAIGCGVLVAGWLVVLLLLAMAGMMAALFSSGTKVAPTFGPVIERQVNKPVSDFPETTDLSTPESACAAWQRATARKDAQAVRRLSWVKIDPAEEEAWFRDEETRDREGLAIYLKALTESRIVEVQTWRDDLADVITFLPFPPGKGRHPYSARSFGRIGGQWKNLGEDRLPSLEAARASFEQKKAAIWEQLGEFRPENGGASLPIAVQLDKDDRDPFIVRGRVVDEQGNGLSDVIITACCGMGTLATTGEAHSRADGSYELRFHPGSVGLQAATIVPSKPGYFDANLQRQGELFMVDDLAALTKDSKRWGKVDTNKVVLPHRPYQLNFVLLPAAQIRGRFLDESNKPLAKKYICLSGEELPPSSSAYTDATTDDNGYFHFSDVPTTGKWWVGARLRDKFHDVRSEEFSLPIPGTYEFEMEWNSTNAASGLKIHYRLAPTTSAEAAAPANGHGTTQVSPAVSSAAQNLSGPVIERQVNKPVSDFPETTDLSTPESACAAWQRANARKDAQAVSRLSWVKIDPAEEEAWFRDEETRDREGLAIYLKALTESKIVVVQTWRGELADVITFLPFPPGKGRHPYSARSFGRIGGQWKNLGEDRLPSLEAARANFEQKKEAIWEQFQSFQAAENKRGRTNSQ